MSKSGYKDLVAWQKGMKLVGLIYDVTDGFPANEMYGPVSHLRRGAVSVPSNIAEGKAHYSNRDFVRFLRHSRGSLAEIETQVLIAEQRKYLSVEQAKQLAEQLDELGRILSGLINSMQDHEGAQSSRLGTQD